MKKIFKLLLFISILAYSNQLLAQSRPANNSTQTTEEKKDSARPLPDESKRSKKDAPKISPAVLKMLSDKSSDKKNTPVILNTNAAKNNNVLKLFSDDDAKKNAPASTTKSQTSNDVYVPTPPPSSKSYRTSDTPATIAAPASPSSSTPPTHTEPSNPKAEISKKWIDSTILKALQPKPEGKQEDKKVPGSDNPTGLSKVPKEAVPVSEFPVQTLSKSYPPGETPAPVPPATKAPPPDTGGIQTKTPGDTDKTDSGEDPRNKLQKKKIPCEDVKKVVNEYQQTCLSKSQNKQCTQELREYYARFCGSESADSKDCLASACGEEKPEENSCKLNEADYEVLKQMMLMEWCVKGDCDPELVKKTESIFGMSTEELQAVYAKEGAEQLTKSLVPLGSSYCKFIYKKTHCLPSFCQHCKLPEEVYGALSYFAKNCEGKDSKNCPSKVQAIKQKYCDFSGRDEKTGEAIFKEKTVAECMKENACFMTPPEAACVDTKSQTHKGEGGGVASDLTSGQTSSLGAGSNGAAAPSGEGGGKSGCALVKEQESISQMKVYFLLLLSTLSLLLWQRFKNERKKLFLGMLLLLLPSIAFSQAAEEEKTEEKKMDHNFQAVDGNQVILRTSDVKTVNDVKGANVADYFRAKGIVPTILSSDQKCSLDAEKLNFLNSFYQNYYWGESKEDEASLVKMKEQYQAICGEKATEVEVSTTDTPPVSEETSKEYKIALEARQEESVRKQLQSMGKSEEEIKEEIAKLAEKSSDKSIGQVMSSKKRMGADICGCLMEKHCAPPDFCQSSCEIKDPLMRSVVEEVQKKCSTDRNKCSPYVQEVYGKVCKDLNPETCLKMYHCPSNVPTGPKECSSTPGGESGGGDKKIDNPQISDQAIQNKPISPASGENPDTLEGAAKCSMLPTSTVFSLLQILGFMTSVIGSGLFISIARYRKR